MVRRTIVIGSVALWVIACGPRSEQPPGLTGKTKTTTSAAPPADLRNADINKIIQPDVPTFLESATLGDVLGPDGNVSKENDAVAEGHPVALTMKLKESPIGLQTRAVWNDAFGKRITMQERAMGGAKVVTFKCDKPLKAGRYGVIGYWGGNIATEKIFEVVAPKKTK